MRLRSQVIVTIAISFTVLATLLVSINGVLATQRFRQLEDTEVTDQVGRLRSILSKETADLAAKLSDWSAWDDAWKFLSGSNPTFAADQITASAMSGNALELMLFLDPQGKIVHREAVLGDSGAARSAALFQLITDTPALRPNDGTTDTVVAGFLGLDQGLVLFAARPVLHGDGSGPAVGTLIWVRDLTSERLDNLAERLQSQVHLWRQSDAPTEALAQLAGGNRGIQTGGNIAGMTVLNDVLDKPLLCGQVVLPRRTWQAGMTTLWWQSATTILALVLTGFGAIWLLDQLITRRVRSLALQAAAGEQAQSVIQVDGQDEIAELAQQVNQLRNRLGNARNEALGAAEAKASFLAVMSHEIRTPLNGVIGMANLLGRTTLNREQQEYADIISSSADNLLLLLNDILDFSKIEAGKVELEHVPFRPSTVLSDAATLLAGKILEKGVDLVLAFDPELPDSVIGDPGRVRQVLTNLVSNAAKFTEKGAVTVRATTTMEGNVLRLTVAVEDTGIGMSADACGRMFQAFSQAESSTARKYGGTGLGLAICKRLVELMHGTIGVTSVPGRGSVFSFTVALQPDGVSSAPIFPLPACARVLIAASEYLSPWLTQAVTHWGGTALSATSVVSDGNALHRALQDEPPALVIVDRRLPGLGEQDVCSVIQERWPGVPLVLMATPQDRSAPAGVVVIAHPIRPDRLMTACTDALNGNVPLPTLTSLLPSASASGPIKSLGIRYSGRVLVVDDHPINRRLAQVMLGQLGITVSEATDGQEALDMMALEPVDLVLMDCQMPVMDGWMATSEWRRREASQGKHLPVHVPIIALTANAFREDRNRCLAAGMDDFLTKPLRDAELRSLLDKYLTVVEATPEEAQKEAEKEAVSASAMEAFPAAESAYTASVAIEKSARDMLCDLPGTVAGINLFDELTQRFSDEFAERFDALVACVISEDSEGTAQKSHALRGSCLTLGMQSLGVVLGKVEQCARVNDLASAVQLLGDIDHEWNRVLLALKPQK